MEKIIAFNKDQIDHIQRVQKHVFDFCSDLINEAITHDTSKFSEMEYSAFIESRDSLKASQTGQDDDYQKHLKSDAIQHHITENKHHPEYWDKRDTIMPIVQAIIMFFDWKSRSEANGADMSGFWDFNMKKLESQPQAKSLVNYLRGYTEREGHRIKNGKDKTND